MACLVNGVEGAFLDPFDRGLHYGDGVFRTLRVQQGQARWWHEHLDTLSQDAARLGIPCPAAAVWQADLEQLAARLSEGVLKLVLTRGVATRGYRPPHDVQTTRLMAYDPATPASDSWPEDGLKVRLCSLKLSAQPRLAGIKHLNRLENVLARSEWDDPEIQEGLLQDASGRVISGVMSNLFLWRDGKLKTPRLEQCGVAGVTRGRLMRDATAAGIEVLETEIGLDDLRAAEEVMLCNSVMGLRRVARLADRHWPQPAISIRLNTLLDA